MVNSTSTRRIEVSRHRGWSTHNASKRYRQAQPNRPVIGILRHIRRPRHTRDASTARASPRFLSVVHYSCESNWFALLCGRTQRSTPTRRSCYRQQSFVIRKRISHVNRHKHPRNAMCGGMMSGWAASRTSEFSDTASQLTFGGYQGGHRPRWSIPQPQDGLR
jgi:hypothetical protein